jgi:uncharacterized protein
MRAVYLHGFASSPASEKAKLFAERFAAAGHDLLVPDLNAPSFRTLTLSRIVATVEGLVPMGTRAVIIGSSMGGYAAALFAARHPERVAAMVLMAPAFNLSTLLERRYGGDAVDAWRRDGTATVDHPNFETPQTLDYAFLEDARRWAGAGLDVRCPTLILHGRGDEDVPVTLSEAFAEGREGVSLVTYDAGHRLETVVEDVWARTWTFLAPWLA